MFDIWIALYLFLAGAGGGVSLVTFFVDGGLMRRAEPDAASQGVVVFGLTAGFALVAAGTSFLLADLGRPERVLNLFLYPGPNCMSFGVFAITMFLLCSLVQLLVRVAFRPRIPVAVFAALRWVCAIAAAAVLLYTGFLLRSWGVGIEFWDSWLLPGLFAASGLSCGLALLQLGILFAAGGGVGRVGELAKALSSVELATVAAEAVLLAGYLLQMWYDSGTAFAVGMLIEGGLSHAFWLGAVLAGVIVPLSASLLPARIGGARALRLTSALCVLAGSLCLRCCVLLAAF